VTKQKTDSLLNPINVIYSYSEGGSDKQVDAMYERKGESKGNDSEVLVRLNGHVTLNGHRIREVAL
jgi:hypothetical protein